jgi:uncharacterized protein
MEKDLWRRGIRNWNDLLCQSAVHDADDRYAELQGAIARSQKAVASQNAEFFLQELPKQEWFRIYPVFRSQLHFLDIETDSLSENATITCLSIMNEGTMVTFMETEGLESAAEPLASVQIAVTFNGTGFDIPRLMRRFPTFYPKYHLDLAQILKKRKVHGTLKDVASRFGWSRDGADGAIKNGREAAQAWGTFLQSGDRSILGSLRRYNQEDVQILEFVLQTLARRHARAHVS